MIYCDCHTHTLFSDDGREPAEEMIKAAVEKGLKHIAITDHCDPLHPEGYLGVTEQIRKEYLETLLRLKEKYRDKISVAVGLEIGYMPQAESAAAELIDERYPEYIINSVHCVNGRDCYEHGFFDDLTRDEALKNYLDAVLKSVSAPYRYDAVGHIGYISRVAPYENRAIRYEEFSSLIDGIFSEIIRREAILEVNTSVSRAPCDMLPDLELLKIYYDMGGRKVTTSSDAHTTAQIGYNFSLVQKTLKSIGFTCLTARMGKKELEFRL